MTRAWVGRSVAASVAVVTLLSGCSGGDSNTVANDTGSKPTAGGTEKSGSGGSGEVEKVDLAAVIAKQTLSSPDNPQNTIDFGLQSLTVEGKIATLRFVATPHFKSVGANEVLRLFDLYKPAQFAPYLLDRANLKRYSILNGSTGGRFASDDLDTRTVNNAPMAVYAVFAAPEDAIATIDVHMADYWPAFKNVPFKR